MAKKTDKRVFRVDFGGVSIGKEGARLEVKIDRNQIASLELADDLFCCRRLTVDVAVGDVDIDQEELFDKGTKLSAIVETKGINAGIEKVTVSLNFALNSIYVATLARFSSGVGVLRINEVTDLEE